MLKVSFFRAEKDLKLGRKATFYKGKKYMGRLCKQGMSFMLLSEEGTWFEVWSYRSFVVDFTRFKNNFSYITEMHVRNRKVLTHFHSTEEFLKLAKELAVPQGRSGRNWVWEALGI